jgi:CheY-like chemotaxis protein
MPGQIVLVHNAARFASESASALRGAGYDVAVFTDPMQALDALDADATVELLITRVNYPGGKPHGVALALMARNRRPGIRVVFTARAEMKPHADGIGEFLPAPVAIPDLVALVRRLLPRRAAPLRVARAPTLREPVLLAPLSGAPDRPWAFSWSTRRLLRLAATTAGRSRRLHDRAAQLHLAAAASKAIARSLAGRG